MSAARLNGVGHYVTVMSNAVEGVRLVTLAEAGGWGAQSLSEIVGQGGLSVKGGQGP